MKRQKFLSGLLALMLASVSWYPGLGHVRAHKIEPYVPSGILVSDLGDELPPGRLNVRFPRRDPLQVGEEIRALLQRPSAPFTRPGLAQTVPAITAEIETLATGLEDDPLAIYDYVHNHVDYVPSWGLLKNPRETLLAGAGNAFDQAALLGALLEAAGLQTRYVWGNIRMTKTAAMNWVGSHNPSTVGNVFASGGIPATDEGNTLLLSHVWVEVFDSGVWHSLDPSFKAYDEQSGQDLHSLLSYNLSTFTSQAQSGATIDPDYVQNLNDTNIRADLASYALALVNNLRSGDAFIYPEDLIGSRQIVPIESAGYPSTLPYTVVATSGQADEIPDSFAYELNVQLPGINYTANLDDIAGERITIFYECATPTDCQTLQDGGGIYEVYPAYQVNMVPKLRVGGAVVATGNAVPLGSWNNLLNVTVATPISGWSPSFSQYLTAGEWYALPMRLQTVSNRALSRHIGLLNEAMSQGLDPDDERVLGQILYVLGLSYFNEVDLGDRIDSRLAEIIFLPHFSMMIASRNLIVWVDAGQNPVALDPASHTVDVRLNIDTAISAEDPADADRERAWFFSAGMRGSAVEHAIIEQLQPVSAVSTVQLLKLAVESGQRIYYITPGNWNTVSPDLGHPVHVLNALVDALNDGQHVVISQDPVTYGQWQGSGWIALDPDSGSAGYLISGSVNPGSGQARLIVNGGGGAFPQPPGDSSKLPVPARTIDDSSQERADQPDTDKEMEALERVARSGTDPASGDDPINPSSGTRGDPVDATIGSFLYHHVDLAPLGGRGISLRFERFYASSRHSLTSTLGYGWSHSYNTRFYFSTDWLRGLGGRTALEAAAALAAAQVGLDLFDTTSIPHQRFAMDVIVAQWLVSQITDNAATISESDGSVSAYVRAMDDVYQSPTGRSNLSDVTTTGSGTILDWEDGGRSHFDASGRLSALDDANGNSTTLNYDGQGRLNQISDAVGRSLTFSYDAQDHLIWVTDPAGRTFRYGYDGQGDLQTYIDPSGGVTTYTYDADHRLTTITDPLSTTYVVNQYNDVGWVEVQTNGRGSQITLLYGGDHTTVVGPPGYRTALYYDGRNRLLSIKDALGNRRWATFDAADHQVTHTDGLGQTTTFAYDAWGHLTTITDTLGYAVTWSYNSSGDPVSYTDQRGETWQFTYDGRHNLTSITDPLGNAADYVYNGQGQLTRAENDAGVYASYDYDAHGNLNRLTNALGASRWSYDNIGRPTSFSDGTGHVTQFSYDALDRLVQVTDPLGHSTSYTYDANGSLTGVTDANGHTTVFAYDAQFNLISATDAIAQTTSFDYDANDRLETITDANGHETTYQYDAVGRLVAITDPLGRTVTFAYDAAGRLVAFGRADGSNSGYQRDALGRLTGVDHPTGPDVAYTYDAAGNLTHAAYGSGWSASYSYDDAGRLIEIEDESRNLTTGYEYDAANRRTRLQIKRDATVLYDVVYGYNAASRLTTLTDQTGVSTGAFQFGYDAAGRLEQIAALDGTHTDYVYDAAARVASVGHQNDPGSQIASYTYTYDAVGNVTAVNETTPVGDFVTTYTYDALDRLVEETYARYAIEFDYDAAGNLTSRSDSLGTQVSTYDAADQLQGRGSESFDYDQHGNLITWDNDLGTYSYTYNYENLLTNLTLPGGNTLAFSYDAFDRRLTIQGPAGIQSFLYDGLDALLNGDVDLDQVTARYLYGNDSLLARYTGQLGFTAYLGDNLENVRFLTDGNGQSFDAYYYEAYGYPLQPAGVDPNPYRFDGKRGVYQPYVPSWPSLMMGYRNFDPPGGRFVTRDPLPGDQIWGQTLNDYAFASGDPLGGGDYCGLRPERPSVARAISPVPLLSSLQEDGGVSTDPEPATNPRPPDQTKRRAVSPTKIENLPVEMGGSPDKGCCGRREISILEADSTRWLPVAAHGSTFALACTTDNRLLAGAFHAGLFQSLDSGHALWDKAYTAGVGEIIVVGDSTYYAGAWYSATLKSGGDGFWTPVNNGLTANHVYALAADPSTPNRIFAGTEMGLFVSANGGDSWGRTAGDLPGRSVSELAFAANTLLAVSEFGLYRSPDGGSTWLTPTTSLDPVRINALLPGAPGSTVYAGTALGAFKSTDAGDTWTPWGTGLEGKDVHALAIDPTDANHTVAGTTAGLFVSADGGANWTPDTNAGLDGIASQVGALAFCPGGGDENLYLGAGGGVYALRTPVAPDNVTITGPTTVTVGINYIFTAAVLPPTTSMPLNYAWGATDLTPVNKSGVYKRINAESFSWAERGNKTITVTVSNSVGTTSTTYAITVVPDSHPEYYIYLPLVLRGG